MRAWADELDCYVLLNFTLQHSVGTAKLAPMDSIEYFLVSEWMNEYINWWVNRENIKN